MLNNFPFVSFFLSFSDIFLVMRCDCFPLFFTFFVSKLFDYFVFHPSFCFVAICVCSLCCETNSNNLLCAFRLCCSIHISKNTLFMLYENYNFCCSFTLIFFFRFSARFPYIHTSKRENVTSQEIEMKAKE